MNVLDNPRLELVRAFAEEENACRSLFDDGSVSRADRALEITDDETQYSYFVIRRDRADFFTLAPLFIALIAVRDTLAKGQVAAAEHVAANSTDAKLLDGQWCVTPETGRRKARKHNKLR